MAADVFRFNLKRLRKAKGWTLQNLADEAGTSQAYLSQLETGRRIMPPGPMLSRLAAALGVSLAELVCEPTDGSEKVLRIWSAIPEDKRDQAIRVLEAFIDPPG